MLGRAPAGDLVEYPLLFWGVVLGMPLAVLARWVRRYVALAIATALGFPRLAEILFQILLHLPHGI